MSLPEQLCSALTALPGVEASASRVGSRSNAAWSVAGREFAHLHADHLLDLRLPRALQADLRSDARAHFRKSRSEWIEFEFHTPEDVALAGALARAAWAAAKDVRLDTGPARKVKP